MGALHNGHMSLIKRARAENDVTVVSIFINPLQFGPSEDLDKYPREIETDVTKLRNEEIDILFLPDNSHMYGDNFLTSVNVDSLSEKLCGLHRPMHFRGVATVVAKLFNIVCPSRAYFGQKDFQQAVVIKKMGHDLNSAVDVIICPTVRESDGLAMSSRNMYLDEHQRKAATVIFRCLSEASNAIISGIADAGQIKKIMHGILSGEPKVTRIDYAALYDPVSLDEIQDIGREVLIAVAVRLGDIRLIDNSLVNI